MVTRQRRIINGYSRLNLLTNVGNPISNLRSLQRRYSSSQYAATLPFDQGSIPSVPQSVTVSLQTNNIVRVSWAPCPDVDIDHYLVYRGTDSSGTGATLVAHKSHVIDQTNYVEVANDFSGTTYYYAVVAVDQEGLISPYSAWTSVGEAGKITGGSGGTTWDNNGITINSGGGSGYLRFYNLNTGRYSYFLLNVSGVLGITNETGGKTQLGTADIISPAIPNGEVTDTLVNGSNLDVAFSAAFARVDGPDAPFSIGSIAQPRDGKIQIIVNTTTQAMTIVNASGGGTAAYRILTGTGGDVVAKHAMLIYDPVSTRWRLIGHEA